MVELVINPTFPGPTLLELDPVMDNVQGTIEVKWQGTKEERALLQKYKDRNFRLVVPDLPAMERAATALGRPYVFDMALLIDARTSLTSRKAYNWRAFAENFAPNVTRSILTRLSASSVRNGKQHPIAKVASECLIDGINPVDADVLLRLRVLRGD